MINKLFFTTHLKYFSFSIILILYSLSVKAEYKDSIIIYSETENPISIGDRLYILEDASNQKSFEEIVKSHEFARSKAAIPNLGVSQSTFWVKFTLSNNTLDDNILLEFAQPIINDITFYTPHKNGYIKYNTGDQYAFNNRIYKYPNFVFDLNIKSHDTQTYFIKIKGDEQILLPLTLGTSHKILERLHHEDLIFGIYCGIMLVMFFYNLFIFFSVKDKIYLYYVIHILFVGLTQACLLGYPFQYLWPDFPYWANLSVYLFPCSVGITAMFFIKFFLETPKHIPTLHKFSYFIIGLYSLTACVSLLGFMNTGYAMVQISAVIIALYMLIVAIIISNKGFKPAKFFLIGWSIMLIGIVVFVLKDFGIFPPNIFTNYTMPAGSALETILLSFALADRINVLKKEKVASQAEVLLALKENEKLITEQNIILEQKVEERTQKLNETNKELNTTLKDLKDTQAQLVDAEKMASLGQLTAGIAHEINNPINFVSANVKPLQLDIEDLLTLIKKYETIKSGENIDQKIKDIDQFKKKIDFEYIQGEIKTLLHGIGEGAKRTAEIVKGLRNFSRLDEGEIKEANLNEGIESTLTLIRSAIPENIQIIKQLEDIPTIECYPGKLNQVFMNAINNAVQAMQKHTAVKNHTLTISTYVFEQSVCVSVEDTGIGMTPEVKARIFEPFFTTKDVGEGTGLGMSIVFKIIESHGGVIHIDTEVGRGTKIIFSLPKKISI